jgi:hypothetical protein
MNAHVREDGGLHNYRGEGHTSYYCSNCCTYIIATSFGLFGYYQATYVDPEIASSVPGATRFSEK